MGLSGRLKAHRSLIYVLVGVEGDIGDPRTNIDAPHASYNDENALMHFGVQGHRKNDLLV